MPDAKRKKQERKKRSHLANISQTFCQNTPQSRKEGMEKERRQLQERQFLSAAKALRNTKHPLQEVIVREFEEIKTEKESFH